MLCVVMYIRFDSAHLSFLKIFFLGIVFPKGMKDAVVLFSLKIFYLETTFCSDFLLNESYPSPFEKQTL